VNIRIRRQSTPNLSSGPGSTPSLTPAMAAIAVAAIVVQIQASTQLNTREMLSALVIAVCAMAGITLPNTRGPDQR
jgi:hypothetical protein